MLKKLLTLYFSFYLALSPIFAQANSVSQIANQFSHKALTQNININSDRTIINSDNITSEQNTHINANNITHQNSVIKSANLHATEQLNISTKNLAVSSVQNKYKSKTRSQGASLGIGSSGVNSVGFNQSKADENSKTVLLTSMTAKQVNITTQEHTQLTGSLIAATDTGDKDGNDNGQLNLTTNSLSASSLNTTINNKYSSMGFNLALSNSKTVQKDKNGNSNKNNKNNKNGNTNNTNKTNKTQNSTSINNASINYTNNKHNAKTKVLATLGNGNIQIADINQSNSKSSTKLLNRDIKDTEVDIYNIASHKGLKGELDTRLLTKAGRVKIAQDIKKSGMIASAIKQILNTDRAGLKDFFNEANKLHKTDEAIKAKIANNPALAKALTDPNLTPIQKQQLAKELVGSVMVELGYKALEVKIVANTNTNTNTNDNDNTNDNRAGHYGEDNNIYLIDDNINNTKDLTTTIGHETSHALDNQDPSINTNPQNNASKTDNEIYADNYGDDFGDYVEFASENYGNGNLASTNNRNLGNTPAETQRNTKLVERNNQDYARIDKSKGEDSAIIRYATPILKDPSSAIKIVENGLKAIGVIAGAEIVNHVSDSAQDDVSDIPEIDDVSEVAGTGAPMPDGEPSEDWDDKNKYANNPDKQKKNFTKIKGKRGGYKGKDGSIWSKDRTKHGGEQWKRWDNLKDFENKNVKPKSIWPNGRIRKK